MRRSPLATATMLLFLAWCTGQLLRDRFWLTGLCFYLPSIVVAAMLLLASLWALKRRGVRFACGYLALALVPTLVTLFVENHWRVRQDTVASEASMLNRTGNTGNTKAASSEVTSAQNPVRLLHWNVCWGRYGWQGAEQTIVEQLPHVVIISERPVYADTLSLVKSLGPEYRATDLRKIVAITQGPVRDVVCHVQTHHAEIYSFIWDYQGRSYRVMTADLASSITIHRDPLLRELTELLQDVQPDVLVGDFNAPRRSRRLAQLPTGFRHAYDAAGSGWGYTWPVPVPVYSLDQCILGPKIFAVKYDIQSSQFSDHRLQVLEFQSTSHSEDRSSSPRAGR
jgi:endonuclease/exonuclease/phosphatase (EEP) superfamily protein YafD